MEVYRSNLHLFEKAPVDKALEKTEWIPFSPVSQMAKNAPLEFDIPGNAAAYLDLSKTRLRVGVKITKADGKPIAGSDKVCLVNLGLQSLFRQVDVDLNQTLITASVGSYYAYKAYLDVLLNSSFEDAERELKTELFYKDTYGDMENDPKSNIGFDRRWQATAGDKTAYLEGPIRMRVRIKLYQQEDAFRLMCVGGERYKVEITDALLRVCQVKLHPEIILTHEKSLTKTPAVYPIWRSDIKTFNIDKGSYTWSMDDIYHGEVPCEVRLDLVSASAFSGNYNQNPFNLKTYEAGFVEVMVDGVSVPTQALTPNYKNGDFAEEYYTLIEWHSKGPCIEMKEYPEGYCIYVFKIRGSSCGEVFPKSSGGHTRVNVRFEKALTESVTAVLYAIFPGEVCIDNARNVFVNL